MPEALMVRTPTGFLPQDQDSQDALKHIGIGDVIRCKFTKPRNLKHHRKFFTLVDFAYDHWECVPIPAPWGWITPKKNKDRFRKDLTILAGYYEATYRVDGSTRIEAQSISFGNMGQDEFERLYSSVIDVVLGKILTNYTKDDLDAVVDQLLLGYT